MQTSNQLSHPADNMFSTEPLGAIYTPEQTIFRVWAPTAGKVMLKLYDSPSGGRPRLLSMSRHRDGTWSTMLLGDWRGVYYTYSAGGRDPRFDPTRELIDPYARAFTTRRPSPTVRRSRSRKRSFMKRMSAISRSIPIRAFSAAASISD
jgi:1,4-alpha-glucan branching enzyme